MQESNRGVSLSLRRWMEQSGGFPLLVPDWLNSPAAAVAVQLKVSFSRGAGA